MKPTNILPRILSALLLLYVSAQGQVTTPSDVYYVGDCTEGSSVYKLGDSSPLYTAPGSWRVLDVDADGQGNWYATVNSWPSGWPCCTAYLVKNGVTILTSACADLFEFYGVEAASDGSVYYAGDNNATGVSSVNKLGDSTPLYTAPQFWKVRDVAADGQGNWYATVNEVEDPLSTGGGILIKNGLTILTWNCSGSGFGAVEVASDGSVYYSKYCYGVISGSIYKLGNSSPLYTVGGDWQVDDVGADGSGNWYAAVNNGGAGLLVKNGLAILTSACPQIFHPFSAVDAVEVPCASQYRLPLGPGPFTVRVSIKRVLDSQWQESGGGWGGESNANLVTGASEILEREAGIILQLVEEVDIVDPVTPSSWYDVNVDDLGPMELFAEAEPCVMRWRTDAVNVYLVNSRTDSDGEPYLGYSSMPTDTDHNDIIALKFHINAEVVLAHELGHYFGLFHTFETFEGTNPETIEPCSTPSPDGTTAGDKVCDTPADPNELVQLDLIYGCGCGTCNSMHYQSLRYNLMSYYPGIDVTNALLTDGQVNRALYHLGTYRDKVLVGHETPQPACPWKYLGHSLAGPEGAPDLSGDGPLTVGSAGGLLLESPNRFAIAGLFISAVGAQAPFKCGTLVPVPVSLLVPVTTSASGSISLAWSSWPGGLSGLSLYFQYAIVDPAAVCGVALSNALRADVP